MQEFTVRYWFGDDRPDGGGVAYVSEGLRAATIEDAERIVLERMNLPLFGIDSDGYGRVIIQRSAVRFCSIVPAQSAEESAEQTRAQAVAQEFAARAADAGRVVDADIRRY